MKLAHELSKRGTGKTLYVLDEPTTGLHFHDVSMLLSVFKKLQDAGNTLLIIEHNLDVIRAADGLLIWVRAAERTEEQSFLKERRKN